MRTLLLNPPSFGGFDGGDFRRDSGQGLFEGGCHAAAIDRDPVIIIGITLVARDGGKRTGSTTLEAQSGASLCRREGKNE